MQSKPGDQFPEGNAEKNRVPGGSSEHFDVAAGRRSTDGRLKVEVFSRDMIAVSMEQEGAATTNVRLLGLLTLDHSRSLRDNLSALITVLENRQTDKSAPESWSGIERRKHRS